MEIIAFNKFIKLLTSQPYFVWNNYVNNNHFEEENLKFDIASFKNISGPSIQEIHTKSFFIIEKQFEQKIANKLSKVYFVKSKSIEKRIIETKQAMNDNRIENIVDPIFGFKYKNFQVLAQPKIFSKNNNQIIFLKISTSTRLKDILRFLFDYLVLKHQKIKVEDVSLYILKTKNNYKKHEVDFFETKYINTVKSGRSCSKDDKYNFVLQQLEKSGQGINNKGLLREKFSIIEILKNNKIKEKYIFKFLKTYLDQIIEVKEIKKITYPTSSDASIFANNQHWNQIMKDINNQWLNYSGNLISHKDIINKVPEEVLVKKSKVIYAILNQKHPLIENKKDISSLLLELEKKIIWYDFESMSLPICSLEYTLPFQQVSFQVSLIKTINLHEYDKKNIVIDPKKINYNDFAKIINTIYHQGFKYVVYNKSYENTRLEEMIYILKKESHPDLKNLSKKVDKIITNTIDLQDYFICNSKNKMPKIFIPFLKGRYSIKFIEEYISIKRRYLFDEYKIEKYKNLNIQNGMMAMEKANYRALGIIGDYQWQKLQNDLKKYCENDVKTMIIVYYLIKDIITKGK